MGTSIEDRVNWFRDMLSKHDVEGFVSGFANDATFQDPMLPQPIRGREAVRQHMAGIFAAFPDFRLTGRTEMTKGNEVFELHRATGTNKGPILTPDGKTIPATNKAFTIDAVSHMTFDDKGLIKQVRVYGDGGAMMRQLGITPP